MAEEEIKFELDVVNSNNGLFVKDDSLEIAKAVLDKAQVFVIQDDNDKKRATAIRAVLNKIVKSIDRTRIDSINDFTANFTEQCNTLKELFDARQKEFGEEIKKYTDTQKIVVGSESSKAKKYTLTIKTTNEKAIKKITKLCEEYECELTIK